MRGQYLVEHRPESHHAAARMAIGNGEGKRLVEILGSHGHM
jgi:hypothetical protein